MSTNQQIEYATVTTGLRAPRVAVVFPGHADWDYFARAAMYAASNTWGGAGFVLVPATDGSIDPRVRDAVVAYDPDYVVSYSYTVGDLDKLTPGTIERMLDDRNIEDHENRSRLRNELHSTNVDDEVLARTRVALVTACSSYRMDNGSEPGDEHRWHEREVSLSAPVPTEQGTTDHGPLTAIDKIRRPFDPTPACGSPALIGDIGVAAVMRLGILSAPNARGPMLNESQRTAVLRWLIRFPTKFPIATPETVFDPAQGTAHGLPTAWDATTTGLSSVVNGSSRQNRRLCVIGGSANDFALAMIWDRLYKNGLWIPDSWINGADRAHILTLLRDAFSPLYTQDRRTWALTSLSHDIEEVAEFRDEILRSPSTFFVTDPDKVDPANDLPVVGLDDDLPYPTGGKCHFGVDEQFSSATTMPVFRDADGTTTLAATPALPILQQDRLKSVPDISWQIDIDIPDAPSPPTRHIPAEAILHPGESPHNTWTRVGRTGLSYEALSYGFVPAGASVDYRLAKPRISKPGMQAWAGARASLIGRTVTTSPAGRHGDVLQTMFGSRSRLIDAISGELLPVFRQFVPQFKTTREQFPNDEGCLVRGLAYLNFPGMVSISGLSMESIRAQCDQLLSERILSRGLILNCSVCGNLDFVVIDHLRQVNECPRCGQPNNLSLSRWKMPAGEPQWFYDLHPVATALFAQNGEVPVLLAAHLRAQSVHSNRYADCAELEVSDSRRGKKLAEADLLALVDDKVLVAEAKSTDELDKGSNQRAAKKRVILAETFGVDEIVLATTRSSWTAASLNAMRVAVKGHDWKALSRPRVREITGLGTGTVNDRYVDID